VTITGGARLLARFSSDGPAAQVLHHSARQQVRLLAFEPWQCLSAWPTEADVTVTVLEGSGELTVGDDVRRVTAGDVCVVPAGCLGAIRSGGRRLIVTEVVAPVPEPA
jgi:quercetin dioxygenase-like cupin family protein